MTDLLEIKTAIVELRGDMKVLTEAMRSGDRESGSGVKLLAQAIENINTIQAQMRTDHKESIEKFEQRTEAIRAEADMKASAVRRSVEGQVTAHANDDAPHERTLGSRLDHIEKSINKTQGALALLAALGLPGVAVVVKFFGGS